GGVRAADRGLGAAERAATRARWPQLLAPRARGEEEDRRERLRDRQRRNGGLDRDQPAQEVAPALDGRRFDQPRSPLLARGELRREPLLLRPGRLAATGGVASARVPRAHRPGR